MARLRFAFRMLRLHFDAQRSKCPYCSSFLYYLMQRKKILIQVRKCKDCGLIYRWPVDRLEDACSFYDSKAYHGQQATDIPRLDILPQLVQQKFRGSEWDKTHRLDFVRRLIGCRGRLLDFGCSWGYGTYQYAELGFDVIGLDISHTRVEFGRLNLKLDLHFDWSEFDKNIYFDVIIADHSLEHLYNIRETIEKFRMHSKPGSKLIIFTPNVDYSYVQKRGIRISIGESHTVAFTMDWFLKNLPQHRFYPHFYTSKAEPLLKWEYLSDASEIALVAIRVKD